MNTAQDHILIVDDDGDIRTLLADCLNRQGLRAHVQSDLDTMQALAREGLNHARSLD